MDLECRQETVTRWEKVSRLTVEREESGEMIVPDACPDIGRVLAVRPRLFLQRKEALEGRGEFSGLIRVGVLYRPEGETGVAAMEVTLPFSATAEDGALAPGCLLWAAPWILSADVHLLNSRKVLVKVIYRMDASAWAERTETFLSLVEDPLPWGIRQKTGIFRAFLPISIQEKTFTLRDALTVPAGQPDPSEILSTEIRCSCTEARVVGDRILFKGSAVLDLLCRDDRGGLFPLHFELPISQLMDGESDGEICRVSILSAGLTCVPDPEDRRSFQVELTLTAQGAAVRTVESPCLIDLYSTSYVLEPQTEEMPAPILNNQDEATKTVRIVLPWSEEQTGRVCLNAAIRLGRPVLREEKDVIILDQSVTVSTLCQGEDGSFGMEKTETVSHRLSAGQRGICLWTAEHTGELTAQPSDEGIEIMASLTFRWLLLEDGTWPVIRRVCLGETLDRGEDAPSLILRSVREGQTLWDVAKSNASTQEDIMAASGLTDEEFYPGQMLVIPRSAG